jgi:hypothetical protein
VGEAVLRGLLAESAKEQDSARRQGRWLLPEGRTVGWRAPVHCRGESGAVALDHKRGRRSERSCVVGPCDRLSNKVGLCAKERQVVFPGGRSVVSRAPVRCCWESEAIAADHEWRQRSKRSYVEGLRSESAKEQDSARRKGKWCSPEGEV